MAVVVVGGGGGGRGGGGSLSNGGGGDVGDVGGVGGVVHTNVRIEAKEIVLTVVQREVADRAWLGR